jgi:Ca-activated chloride channel family protein
MSKQRYEFLFLAAFVALFAVCIGCDLWQMGIRFMADMNLKKGNTAYDEAEYGDAEIYYKKAAAADNTGWKTNYNLANAYYKQGRYAEAVLEYKKALNSPLKARAWYNLGNAYYRQRSFTQSLAAYKMAVLLDNTPSARQNLLLVWQRMNAAAIKQFANKPDNKKQEENGDGEQMNKQSEQTGNERFKDNKQAAQEYVLTNKKMDELLNMVEQNEANKAHSNKKYNQKEQLSTTPDY